MRNRKTTRCRAILTLERLRMMTRALFSDTFMSLPSIMFSKMNGPRDAARLSGDGDSILVPKYQHQFARYWSMGRAPPHPFLLDRSRLHRSEQ